MKIHEAVEKALKEKKPITRRELFEMGFMILPTNSSECCYVLTEDMKKRPGRCWNPTANDLIANDWIVVKTVQRRPEMQKCPVCGNAQISEQDNFCTNCGTKLKLVCDCWVKKGSYNCNESSCPGYRLNYKELKDHNLGGRIADLLKKSGLTQRELADKVGVTEVSMSRYISGDRTPKGPVIANIANALHTTSDYLLGTEETL